MIARTGDLIDNLAVFWPARGTHPIFFAYIFDDYVFQWLGYHRQFARLIAPFIFKNSAGVIGPNEYICEEFEKRYRIHPNLARNPCDREELRKEPYQKPPGESGKIKIIYTGAIYHANFDCFHNLIQTLDSLKEYKLELHTFTTQTNDELKA
jgi:hypothetical protein